MCNQHLSLILITSVVFQILKPWVIVILINVVGNSRPSAFETASVVDHRAITGIIIEIKYYCMRSVNNKQLPNHS